MSSRVTKSNGQATSAFRRLTRADLGTFDREATDLVLEAMRAGCVGRVSSRGHAILRNNAGGSVAVPRSMTAPNRTAQNARADMKRLLAGHRRDHAASAAERTPRRKRQMTVSMAFVEHPSAFSRWFDTQPEGLPADQLIEVSFDGAGQPAFHAVPVDAPAQPDAPEQDQPEPASARPTRRRGHLTIAPEPGQEAEDEMAAEAHGAAVPGQRPGPGTGGRLARGSPGAPAGSAGRGPACRRPAAQDRRPGGRAGLPDPPGRGRRGPPGPHPRGFHA